MMALLLATFVVVPIADAALCAFEAADTHAYHEIDDTHLDGDTDDSQAQGSGYGHGPCSHGYCHHTSLSPEPMTTASPCLVHHWPPDIDAISSHMPDGLKRPPRA